MSTNDADTRRIGIDENGTVYGGLNANGQTPAQNGRINMGAFVAAAQPPAKPMNWNDLAAHQRETAARLNGEAAEARANGNTALADSLAGRANNLAGMANNSATVLGTPPPAANAPAGPAASGGPTTITIGAHNTEPATPTAETSPPIRIHAGFVGAAQGVNANALQGRANKEELAEMTLRIANKLPPLTQDMLTAIEARPVPEKPIEYSNSEILGVIGPRTKPATAINGGNTMATDNSKGGVVEGSDIGGFGPATNEFRPNMPTQPAAPAVNTAALEEMAAARQEQVNGGYARPSFADFGSPAQPAALTVNTAALEEMAAARHNQVNGLPVPKSKDIVLDTPAVAPPAVAAPAPVAPAAPAQPAAPERNGPGDGDKPAPAHYSSATPESQEKAAKAVFAKADVKTIKQFQEACVRAGIDMGASGKGQNGIDGDPGPKTIAAFVKMCNEAGIDPAKVDLKGPANQETTKLLREHLGGKIVEHERDVAVAKQAQRDQAPADMGQENWRVSDNPNANLPKAASHDARAGARGGR